jgi:hypothetical protein
VQRDKSQQKTKLETENTINKKNSKATIKKTQEKNKKQQ